MIAARAGAKALRTGNAPPDDRTHLGPRRASAWI